MLVLNVDILKYKMDTLDNYSKNWTQTDPISNELDLQSSCLETWPYILIQLWESLVE